MADARPLIGRPVARPDGPAKVSGVARYPQDLPLPQGTLHLATVRAHVACASLDGIDASLALAVDGVRRVITAADVRGTNRFGLVTPDQPVLVERDIVGASDVVALVVGTTERAAREGARRVRLALTPRTGIFDPERALEPGAPSVHPARSGTSSQPNLLAERVVRRGNATRAMERAAVVVEGTYRTGWVEHAFLAPEAGIAWPERDGSLVLHVATQHAEADLRQAAEALGEPRARLRMVQATIGGAFGGREDVSVQLLLLLAARVMDAPVRMVWDRRESVRGHGKRHPFSIRYRMGGDATGRIVAAEVDLMVDAGCYASTSGPLLDNALAHVLGPYDVAHVSLRGRVALTNNPYTCAFRGFGINQVTFAVEQQVNKLAQALGLSAASLRKRNCVRSGGRVGIGSNVASTTGFVRAVAAVHAAAECRPLPTASGRIVYGRGYAGAMKNVGFGFGADDKATAEVHLARQRAVVRIATADVGQGSETVLAQIAATELALPMSRVRVEWQDTDVAPDGGGSSASRQTMASGNAVRLAARAAARALVRRGGWERLTSAGLTVRRTWRFPATKPFASGPGRHLATFGWGACAADVSVDLETGVVTLLRVVNAADAGRVVNPVLFRGQMEGGVVMGQGYALQERVVVHEGMPRSLGFEQCGIPTALDAVPQIEVIPIELRDPIGPFGARGIGEVAMLPVVPAITAAIHDACGVWIDAIPASPLRVLAALEDRKCPTPPPVLGL